jgi:calcineurin-like phosphoesterase family protein
MKIFTSDLHHMHNRIVEFTNRGESTTQENHTQWLTDVWNKNVSSGDLVYHLGDFSFAKKYDDIALFMKKLNGQKIFIKGNHDKRENLDQLVKDKLISAWYDYKEIKLQDVPTVLFHFPIASWHRQSHGAIHLHGHSHGNFKDFRGKMLDVGIDSAYNLYGEHKFITEDEVIAFMQHEDIYTADQHRKVTDAKDSS